MLFVVISKHGEAWDRSRPLREQRLWDEHARFMDSLVDDGFVILGGPLHDGSLLIVAAAAEDEVHSRLASDPWETAGMLHPARIERWEVLLGDLPATRPASPESDGQSTAART